MKALSVLILILTAAVCVAAGPIEVFRIDEKTVRIEGVADAFYSPSGKLLAIQGESNFLLLSTRDLSKIIERSGNIIGFLPSETLVFSDRGEIFALAPPAKLPRRIFAANLAKNLIDAPGQSGVVIVSNDLIVAGGGSFDWGGRKGNIFRFNLKTKRMTKGARVWAFWYTSLSPSGRYVLYEHGAEDTNNADLYDVLLDKNYPIHEYFSLEREFPGFEWNEEVPIAWLAGRDRFLAEIMTRKESGETDENWLVLFDVPSRKIIWKKLFIQSMFPPGFQQIDDETAFIDTYDGIYELSLTTGEMKKSEKIDGARASVSPDKKRIAFINVEKVFVASTGGRDKKQIFELPRDWEMQRAYKGMGERPPLWSPSSDRVILFGKDRLFLIEP